MTSPAASDQLDHAPRGGEGLVGVAGAERAPDDDLPGDRDRVEHEREEDEELEGDLVGGRRSPRRCARSTAVASTKQPSSAAVRTTSCAPIDTSERMRARSGGGERARSSTAANAIAHPGLRDDRAPAPSRRGPSRSRRRSSTSSTTLTTLAATTMTQRRAQVAHAAQLALAGERDQRDGTPSAPMRR